MAGVQVIWFSVPVTCIYANVTTLQHFLSIYCQHAHFFCIHQRSVHVVHYKSIDKLNLMGSLNVWRPCKWFTFHWYVLMCCVLTTQRQFSTTSGPHWNVTYTLINTARVVHYRSAVFNVLAFIIQFQHKEYLNSWLYFISFLFTIGHFRMCVIKKKNYYFPL